MPEISHSSRTIVGIEINADKCAIVELASDGAVSRRVELQCGDESFDGVLVQLIDRLKRDFAASERVGIALPGTVDHEKQRVELATWLPELSEIDIGARFAEAGVQALIENDANAAAYAEYKVGAGRGSSSMYYAALGQGVGGAFIHDGKLWRGARGFAGELGDVIVDIEGVRLEDVASSANIVRRSRTRFHQDSTSVLSKVSEDDITFRDILNAAEQGDDLAGLMLERTGTYVGTAVAAVINILNVERVVVGGEMVHSGSHVLDAIVESARQQSFEPSFEGTLITAGEITANAAAIGAAFLANEI